MRILKRIALGIAGLLLLVVLTVVTIFLVGNHQTSYLKAKKHAEYAENTYVIINANVLPMNADTILVNKSVYIKNGVIKEIGDDISTDNIPVIDAHGKYLTPGLVDMHVHVWDNYELGLYLANGVTSVRNVWGLPLHLRMKKAINSGKLIAPDFYTSGPKLSGPDYPGDDNLQIISVEQARAKVHEFKEQGFDLIKTYNGLTPELFDAIVDQARIEGLDIAAHPSQNVDYAAHFNPQVTTIEHTEDIVQQPLEYTIDSLKFQQVLEDFKASPQTSFTPTLIVYYNILRMLENESILSSEEMEWMNPLIKKLDSQVQYDRWAYTKRQDSTITSRIKQQHDFHLYIIKKMQEAGVNIVCGTDAGIGITTPGASLHEELALYHEAGLSNFEALQTATVNASRTHQFLNDIGTIEIGKKANLLLVDGNPLEDLNVLKHPDLVFMNGHKITSELLKEFEEKARTRKNQITTGLQYGEFLLMEK